MAREERCSPGASPAASGTCFTAQALRVLTHRWNERFPERRIPGVGGASAAALWRALRARMAESGACGKGSTEACWVEAPASPLRDPGLAAGAFVPAKPAGWARRPTAWLSSVDINRVMQQYASAPAYRFRWLGALPRDFAAPHPAGGCVADAACELDVRAEVARGARAVGAIFNHDPHDQGGSHWVAAFAGLDPARPLYGVHFSNSTGEPPLREFREWCVGLAAEVGRVTGEPCPVRVNVVRRQRYNTECGMHSLYTVIRCLQTTRGLDADGRRLKKGSRVPRWEDLCAEHARDADMVAMRDVLFRDLDA